MALGNMRESGVRSLSITCGALHCHHGATMDVSGFADDVQSHPLARIWSARCAALSVPMLAQIGVSERQSACSGRWGNNTCTAATKNIWQLLFLAEQLPPPSSHCSRHFRRG